MHPALIVTHRHRHRSWKRGYLINLTNNAFLPSWDVLYSSASFEKKMRTGGGHAQVLDYCVCGSMPGICITEISNAARRFTPVF